MISLANNYATADDDTCDSLKACTIQNSGQWNNNNNKRENPPQEQHTLNMVATTFSEKGQGGQRGRGRGSNSGALQLPPPHQLRPYPTMSIATCHALPIGTK
jgi:hypothetical protein